MAICIKEALKMITSHIKTVSFEIVPIENCGGRVMAEDIFAKFSLPNYNNSAMDGYGVILDDIDKHVTVIDTIFAGSSKETQITKSQCVKIMTGAKVPKNVEAVVPFELAEIIDENTVKLPSSIKKDQHIRFIGEDIMKDELLIQKEEKVNFATVTLLASQGITHVKVYKIPKVSVFASGEELKLHYEKIREYQIYNSNTPTLLERVKELGCDVTFVGMAQDNIDSLQTMIKNSLDSNLIITTGGISVGEADFTKDAFEQLNMEILFNGITIKPGKPTVFGKIDNTYIINLPGNPLASALIFEMFGTVMIQKLSGDKNIYHNYIEGKISEDLKNKKGRTTIVPGYFNGTEFAPAQKRLPGMVNVLHKCNSLIVLNRNFEQISKNSIVKIVPINWKFFTNEQIDFFN